MFKVVALEGCPYSQNAVEFFTRLRDRNPRIKVDIVAVDGTTKSQYQTRQYSTFPQISYHVKSGKHIRQVFIGGWDQWERLMAIKDELKQTFGPPIWIPLLFLMNAQT